MSFTVLNLLKDTDFRRNSLYNSDVLFVFAHVVDTGREGNMGHGFRRGRRRKEGPLRRDRSRHGDERTPEYPKGYMRAIHAR